MVESGQGEIRPVSFAGQRHPGLMVEVLRRSEVVDRVGPAFFVRPDRPSFDTLMLVERGLGRHGVDFEQVALLPGRLVRTRPGQVQSWDVSTDVDATLVLCRAVTPAAAAWLPGQGASADLSVDSLTTAEALIDSLRREQARFDGDPASTRLMTALYEALEALFDRSRATSSDTPLPDAYVAFRAAIEDGLGARHHVRDYARAIGYSERTIARACLRVTGRSAKAVLDQRITLEAQRLLAHTDRTAGAIAAELGFTDATTFHKFFVRNTGTRPARFREVNRRGEQAPAGDSRPPLPRDRR